MMKPRSRIILVAIIGLGILGLSALQYERLRNCRWHLESALRVKAPLKFEQLNLLERKAIAEWAALNGITVKGAIDSRDIRTLKIGNQNCVVLLLERGAVGGSPVYCFDNSDKLIARYDKIE